MCSLSIGEEEVGDSGNLEKAQEAGHGITIIEQEKKQTATEAPADEPKYVTKLGGFSPKRSDDNCFAELWSKHCEALVSAGHSTAVLEEFTNPQLLGKQLIAIYPNRVTLEKAENIARQSGAKILNISKIEPLTVYSFTEWSRASFAEQTLDHWRMAMINDVGVCGISPFGRREVWPLKDEDPGLLSLFLFSWQLEENDHLISVVDIPGRPTESDSLEKWKEFLVGEWEVLNARTQAFTSRHVFFADGRVERWQGGMRNPLLMLGGFATDSGQSWQGKTFRWKVSAPGEILIIDDKGNEFDRAVLQEGYPAILKTQKNGDLVWVARRWGTPLEERPYERENHEVSNKPQSSAPIKIRHHNQGRTDLCVGFSNSIALQQAFRMPFERKTVFKMCDIASGGGSEESGKGIADDHLLLQIGIPYETISCSPLRSFDDRGMWRIVSWLNNGSKGRRFKTDTFRARESDGNSWAIKHFIESEFIPRLREGYVICASHSSRDPSIRAGHQVAFQGYSEGDGMTTLFDSSGGSSRKVDLAKWCDTSWNHDRQDSFRIHVLPRAWGNRAIVENFPQSVELRATPEALNACNFGDRPFEITRMDPFLPDLDRRYCAPLGMIAHNWGIFDNIESPSFYESRIWLMKFNIANGRSTYVALGKSRHDYQVCLLSGYRPGEFKLSYPVFNSDKTLCTGYKSEWIGEKQLIRSMKIPWAAMPEVKGRQELWASLAKTSETKERRHRYEELIKKSKESMVTMYYFHNMKIPFLEFVK